MIRWAVIVLVALGCARPPARGRPDVGTGALARWSRGEGPRPARAEVEACEEEECVDDEGFGEIDDDPGMDDDGLTDAAPDPTDDYTASSVLSGGSVGGRVVWTRAPRPGPRVPAGDGCQPASPPPVIQRDGSVTGAVVYLEQIVIGKPPQAIGGVLTYRRCVFSPRVQLAAPIGALALVANDGGGATQLELHHLESATSLSLPFSDGRYLELPLAAAGTYRLRTSGAAPGQTAWIIVPRHPYFAVTGENGQFLLQDVPAGAYTLVAWHSPPGDHLGAPPVVARIPVRVHRGRSTTVSVDLGRR